MARFGNGRQELSELARKAAPRFQEASCSVILSSVLLMDDIWKGAVEVIR